MYMYTGGVVSSENEDCVVGAVQESGEGHGHSELTVPSPPPTSPTCEKEAGNRGDQVPVY